MAWCRVEIVFVLFQILCRTCFSDQQQNTLNVPQVLLPYPPRGTVNANFTLKALRGCYSWSSNRPEVATVEPIYQEEQGEMCDSGQQSVAKPFGKRCSQEAVVTAQSRSPDRQMAVVIAEEEVTGLMLRCDVFVDKVHKIEITTTTRELLLGESPEVFDVQAFDEEGNLFTTLDGMIFSWDLITVDSVHAESILRIVPFEESTYETSPEIYALEAKGLRGSSVIVEPINTGTAIVRAKLREKAFENVAASSVKLVVRDNIMLRPGHDVYIMVNTTLTYTVVRLRQGKATVLPMPSTQFEFKLTNYTVGSLNIKRSSVLGTALGFTQIVLVDKNMLQIQTSHNPSASIYVVEPAYIGFSIVPDSNWVLEVGREYAVSVQLFDKDGHKIYMADNIMIHSTFSDVYFNKMWSSVNGSYHHVKTLKRGKTLIKAIYTSIKIEGTDKIYTFEYPISGQQEAEIFDPVLVEPDLLVFPWHPLNGQKPATGTDPQYQYSLSATGGSGSYVWSSSNTSIATVSTKGTVMTTTSIGHTQVRAADSRNTAHFGTTEVYVLPPGKMEFIPSPVEAEIDTVLSLPLAVATRHTDKLSKEYQVFTDCRGIPLSYTLSDPSIFQVIEGRGDYKIQPYSCMSVRLKAQRPGFSQLIVTYQYKDILLKASVTIGAYLPLQVLDPQETALVTLGSVKNLMLEGGPLPWILDTSSYYETVAAEKERDVTIGYYHTEDYRVDLGGSSSLHFFNVLCLELGEQTLTVKVGNRPSSKNPYPANSVQTIRFACDVPASLTIVPVINLPVIDGRQLTPENCVSSNKEIHVRNSQDLKLVLNLRDAQGRLFHNFTSLSVLWSSSDTSRAYFTGSRRSVKMMFIKIRDEENAMKAISYKTVRLSSEMGGVIVRAAIDGYDCAVLRKCHIELKTPVKLPLAGHLKLLLVPERVIEPRVASVYNHPENKVTFRIVGGSGHFAVKGSDAEVGRTVYHGKADIMVIPRSEGLFTLSVHDYCLDSPTPATANVQISDIFGLEVKVVDKVELGTSVSLRVKVLDAFGVPMQLGNLALIKLTPHFTPDILLIKRESRTESSLGPNHDTFYFNLRGLALGTASLTFSASTLSGRSATSEPKDIQVFASLRLDPRVVVLLEGATFQIRANGGPSPQTSTSFVINNDTVASVSNVGLVEALHLGSTNLSGVAQAMDPQTGQAVVYSKDEIMVHVIQLTGIKIHAATTNLVTGTEIGIFAVGLNDESPFTFANAIPGLKFQWTSTNTDVCKLKSVYAKSGIVVEQEDDFRVSLHCSNPGQTTIRLKLLPAQRWNNHLKHTARLTHEVTFQVFERLRVLFPSTGYLLLPHNVNTQIKTSRDGAARITYELITGCNNRHASQSAAVVNVGRHGALTTGSLSGTAAVLLTVHEEYGINQTAVVHVEVKPVVSLTIKCGSHVRANAEKQHAFPLGINALFVVALHDNIGRRFSSSNIPLKYRLNRFDAVHVVPGPENGTFYARAMNLGDAIFKVWDASSPHIADYVRIKVDHGLVPAQATLLLGTVANFKTYISQEGQSGQWSSSNENIVKVDPSSGVALATATGKATIYYTIPNLYTTQTDVLVEPISYVQMETNDFQVMTNLPLKADQGYIIPVTLGTHQAVGRITGQTGNGSVLLYEKFGDPGQLPLRCSLSFRDQAFGSVSVGDLFDAKAGTVLDQTVCYLVPRHLVSEVLRRASVNDMALELTVKVYDKSRTSEVASDAVELPFVPAFVVSDAEVHLTATLRKRSVTVTGTRKQLDSLLVKSQDRAVVGIEPIGREDEDTQVKYEVSVAEANNDSFSDVAVEFKSTITGQKVLVFVTFTGARGIPPVSGKPATSWRRLFLTLLEETSAWFIGFSIIFALVILLLILCCSQRTTPYPPTPYGQPQYVGTPAASPYVPYQGGSYVSSPPGVSPFAGRPVSVTPRGTPANVSLGTTTKQRSPDLFSVRQ